MNDDPTKSSDETLAGKVESSVRDLVELGARFFLTFWYLLARRGQFVAYLQPEGAATSPLARPFSFLALAALPGAIYYEAAARSFSAGLPNYMQVGTQIVTMVGQIQSDDFSLVKILLIALPIVAVATAFGVLISAFYADYDAKKRAREIACYAFGFATLILALGGLAPIVLRALIPSTRALAPGIEMTGLHLPAWAAFSGIPFGLYALYSVGDIIVRGMRGYPSKAVRFGALVCYLAGVIGIYACLLAVWVTAGTNWPFYLNAAPVHHPADSTNIHCRSSSLAFAADGSLTVPMIMLNSSDDPIYAERSATIFTTPFVKGKLQLKVIDWAETGSNVMVVKAGESRWLLLSGKADPTYLAQLPSGSEKVGSGKNVGARAYFIDGIGRKIACNAESSDFPDTERPMMYVTSVAPSP